MTHNAPSQNFKAWLKQLKQSLARPPEKPRTPFFIGSYLVGSIQQDMTYKLIEAGYIRVNPNAPGVILQAEETVEDINVQLDKMAHWLQTQGLCAKWRNEQLPVTDSKTGTMHATVERAIIRVLGIRTFAVHLIGIRSDGAIWLQRRALTKATDPGKLDTLVGGLVAAGEPLIEALKRETWEEAGIRLERPVTSTFFKKGGEFEVGCPIDAEMGGYMIERCIWYVVQLPDHIYPENQDGEVSEFVCLTPEEVVAQMLKGQMAAQAVCILSQWLEKDDGIQNLVSY